MGRRDNFIGVILAWTGGVAVISECSTLDESDIKKERQYGSMKRFDLRWIER